MSNSLLHSFDVHGNHNPMCQQCEIERLRAEVERLKEWQKDTILDIDRARRLLDLATAKLNSGVLITDEQIDALWELMWRNPEQGYRALKLIGIFECPDCVEGWVDVDTGNPQDCAGAKCEKCNGHGWIRED